MQDKFKSFNDSTQSSRFDGRSSSAYKDVVDCYDDDIFINTILEVNLAIRSPAVRKKNIAQVTTLRSDIDKATRPSSPSTSCLRGWA